MLIEPEFLYRKTKVLFACNKSDLNDAKSPDEIKELLEDEITILKDKAYKAQLPNDKIESVGVPGEPFTFSYDCQLKVYL